MQTAVLSARQSRFVGEYLIDGCSASRQFVLGGPLWCARLGLTNTLRIAKGAAELQARQSADATRLPQTLDPQKCNLVASNCFFPKVTVDVSRVQCPG